MSNSRQEYEVPGSLKEMFEEEGYYKIINYEYEMDNVQALNHFFEVVGVPSDNILLHDGTQAFLFHPDFNFHLVIDSSGLGDFFSHQFELTKIQASEYIQDIEKIEQVPENIQNIIKKEELSSEDMIELFSFLHIK